MLKVRYTVCYAGEITEGEIDAPEGLDDRMYVLIGRGLMFEDSWCDPETQHAIGVQKNGEMERYIESNLDEGDVAEAKAYSAEE